MKNMQKSIRELDLLDDFLFTEATMDERTANLLLRLIIERSTGLKVGRLIIRTQRVVNGVDTDYHGMRMDVTVEELEEEEDTIIQFFDIEPNNVQRVHLPKRSRFYQALADVKLLETGVDYDRLPNMWTIWILPYDPFGKNQMVYTVKNRVEEFPEVEYNDGVIKLFLYTGGKEGGSEALKMLLRYIESSKIENAVDEELKELHTNVERLKSNAKIGVKYMQMQEVIKYRVEEALEEASEELARRVTERVTEEVTERVTEEVTERVTEEVTERVTEEVEKTMAKLTHILLCDNRYEDLKRMTLDDAYRKELLAEFQMDIENIRPE